MKQLVLLYWGCIFLMYLSEVYHPVDVQIEGEQTGKYHFLRRRSDLFMVIVIAWMTCFSFLRTSYNDTGNYIMYFRDSIPVGQFLEEGGLLDWTGNPLSLFYQHLVHELTDNYHVFFFFPALLNSFAVIKLLKNYSVNPAFSLLLFFSFGTYVTYIAALKQSFAIFFLLLSIPYAEEKKYIRFYLLVFVATLFHIHAFMFLFLPLFFGRPWNKTTWALLAAAIFALLTYDNTLGAFMEYAQSLGANVAEIEVFDDHQINNIRVLVYWMIPLIALIFRKRLFLNSTRVENLFVNMSCISAFILTIGLAQGANLMGRMAAYFEIGSAIALPWMIKKLFTKDSAIFVTVMVCICFFCYFYFEFAVSKSFNTDYAAISLWRFFADLIQQ